MSTNLPPEFWAARPTLTQIHQAAWSRLRSPDAVLGAVLARVASMTPPAFRLPPTGGTPVSVCFYSVLLGPSGAGKSQAAGVARDLLPIDDPDLTTTINAGSGEGLIQAYLARNKETGEMEQVRLGGYLYIDEGGKMGKLGGRSGSTLPETIREMWGGNEVGTSNASVDNCRRLRDGSYTLGIVMGLQPKLAGDLLAGADGGDPQRYVWFSASDPNGPDMPPAWPGPLRWDRPSLTSATGHASTFEVAPTVIEVIRARLVAVLRGQQCDELDTHAHLLQLKVAALLALLERRLDVTEEDWRLASMVMEVSGAVRASAQDALAEVRAHAQAVSRNEHANKAATAEMAVALSQERRREDALCRLVNALCDKALAMGGEVSYRDAGKLLGPTHRALGLRVEDLVARVEDMCLMETWEDGRRKMLRMKNSGE